MFNEEAEQSLDEYIEETTEARREESIIFYEGCTIVTAPIGPPPEYLTVEVDTINDYNVMWRGVPTAAAVGDEVIVWENPLSHRREIWGGSGTSGVSGGASWCQVVVVAKCGGDFDDITDAIAWINALAAPPAANLLFELYVLAGNWIEGANITVPPFVTLLGMGDGTSIEMGAFDLIMDDDSNLFNVKVTFAASGSLLISSKDRVILEHVHGTQTSNDDILFVDGTSSDVECKDCWLDSAGNEAVRVTNTADVRFDNCKLEAHAGSGYAIVLADTATVRMEWCELTAYVPVFTVAGTTFDHFSCQFDLSASTLAAGTHTALSTKRFNQTLTVAEAGGEFTSLGAAITYINAQADAAAGKLYGVLMLTGNFAEGAPVTIPQYVTVMGMGEGTEIEMGANTLSLAADSSLENLVVESSHNTAAAQVNGVTNVFLRDVRIIQTGGVGGCLYVIGANSEVACRDVILEATSTAMFGFYAQDNGTVLSLEYCTADDPTNFTRALWIANYTVTVTTRYCTFHGNTDDITLSVLATLNHFMCQFDPNNSTLAGTEVPQMTGKANFDDVVTFENGVTFDGLTTQNIITIPDTLADAFHIIDDGAGDVFFRVVTTTNSEEVIFNDGGDNVDFRVEAVVVPNAFLVDGAAGGITVGGPSMTVPSGWWIGIGAALERIVFDATNNDIAVMGAHLGVGTLAPGIYDLNIYDAATALFLVRGDGAGNNYATITVQGDRGANAELTTATYGSGNAWVAYGQVLADWSILQTLGANSAGLIIGTATADPLLLGTNNVERMRILSGGNVGIGTTVPSRILDCNDGSGNMIADGYDAHPSWLSNKVDPVPMNDVLTKFKQLVPYQYKRTPYVSADELAAAGIKEFGERWKLAFPDGYRDGALEDCPDPEITKFLDQLGDSLREERQPLPEWQRLHYGLAMDDLVDTFPDILSRDASGDATGYSLNNYIGLLHACIAELQGRVEQLEK